MDDVVFWYELFCVGLHLCYSHIAEILWISIWICWTSTWRTWNQGLETHISYFNVGTLCSWSLTLIGSLSTMTILDVWVWFFLLWEIILMCKQLVVRVYRNWKILFTYDIKKGKKKIIERHFFVERGIFSYGH